jgi:hypothetical protein
VSAIREDRSAYQGPHRLRRPERGVGGHRSDAVSGLRNRPPLNGPLIRLRYLVEAHPDGSIEIVPDESPESVAEPGRSQSAGFCQPNEPPSGASRRSSPARRIGRRPRPRKSTSDANIDDCFATAVRGRAGRSSPFYSIIPDNVGGRRQAIGSPEDAGTPGSRSPQRRRPSTPRILQCNVPGLAATAIG